MCCLVLSIAKPAYALTGVGALADQLAAGTEIRLVGRTAPWAEVVVVDKADDRVVAVAEIEPTGRFDFRFQLRTEVLAQLQIFGVDDLGVTNRVEVAGIVGQEALLPPTIVNDETDPPSTTRVALTGMSYPGAAISLRVVQEGGLTREFATTTDIRGFWYFKNDELPAGRYTVTARSGVDGLVSELSQEIYFEILAVAVPPVVEEVFERIFEVVPLPPEEAARVLAPVAAVPFVGVLLKDIIALLLRLIYGLLHLLGWRKERRRWGVVYDAVSKHPVARAIVRLYKISDVSSQMSDELMETEVTADEGEFAFLPQSGRYRIKVSVAGYRFPSVVVKGRGRDGEYLNLYHGEVFAVQEGEEVTLSIPVDKLETRVGWWFYTKKYAGPVWRAFGWLMLVLGMAFAIRSLLLSVTTINMLILAFYVGLVVWNLFNGIRLWRRNSVVIEAVTNKAAANITIAVYEVEFNRLIQRRVSDEKGRFLLTLRPGRYRLEVAAVDYIWDKERYGGYKGEVIEAKKRGIQAYRVRIYVRKK